MICRTVGRPLFIHLKGSGESFVEVDIGASEGSAESKVRLGELPSLVQSGDVSSNMVGGRCWESISDSGRSSEGEVTMQTIIDYELSYAPKISTIRF